MPESMWALMPMLRILATVGSTLDRQREKAENDGLGRSGADKPANRRRASIACVCVLGWQFPTHTDPLARVTLPLSCASARYRVLLHSSHASQGISVGVWQALDSPGVLHTPSLSRIQSRN